MDRFSHPLSYSVLIAHKYNYTDDNLCVNIIIGKKPYNVQEY